MEFQELGLYNQLREAIAATVFTGRMPIRKVKLAACLPVPDDCCQECGCNDEAIIIDPGTGGAKQVFHGSGPPSGVQSGMDSTLANIYYDDDDSGRPYTWNVSSQFWNP